MFNITTTVEVTPERVTDLLRRAFEGGSDYWYTIVGYKEPSKNP